MDTCRTLSLNPYSKVLYKYSKPLSRHLVKAGSSSRQVHLKGSTYEDIVDQISQRVLHAAKAKDLKGRRYMIGISGAPGSGKSTLASLASKRINALDADQNGREVSVQLPMDGFHFYKSHLDRMPDPKEAYARRGAHWTFDAEKFVNCVREARDGAAMIAPSFDHALGDPMEGDIQIKDHHKIVLVEGNYVLLDMEPWSQLKQLFDETWFVDVDIDVAMDRVYKRQINIGFLPEVSLSRIAGNDRPNGILINESKQFANVIIPSSVPL